VRGELLLLVGLDLVKIGDIASSVERFGHRFLDRIFTQDELQYCLADAGPSAARLAARFAAKEAARKVLCLDNEAIAWRSIEIVRCSNGWCHLVLHGEALALARAAEYGRFSLSMTHESEYASAVVVCERPRRKDVCDEGYHPRNLA
jgi:holo-[acyl-carrier protein] synthase